MLSRARTFSKNPVHAEADSCVVIVLTHGEEDTLIGTDGNHINIHDFLDFFNSKNAPLLAGKPKIFIIQACRGSKLNLIRGVKEEYIIHSPFK